MSVQMKLQPSESVVAHVASRIYAAYLISGKVPDGQESKWLKRSIDQAIELCLATDDAVSSDDEMQG